MSGRQTTLVACAGCGLGYRLRNLYEVEGPDGKVLLVCGPCYDKWIYGENLEHFEGARGKERDERLS